MIRIVRIYRTVLPIDKERIRQVQEIFKQYYPTLTDYAEKIPSQLNNPVKYGYTSILLICEGSLGRVRGFSLFFYFPDTHCSLLDFIVVRNDVRSSGIGGALYEATREYLKEMGCSGLYMEVLPDDPEMVNNPALLKENQRRMRFYEGYGVRPICGTKYETPIGEPPAPHLLYDGLGRSEPLACSECRSAMRTILTKKYSHIAPPGYIDTVVKSVVDDPVKIREPRYIKKIITPFSYQYKDQFKKPFVIVSSTKHEVHHVIDRGYVERPVRVKAIRNALEPTNLFEAIEPRHFGQEHILAVHDTDFVKYLKAVCQNLQSKTPVYPYVFPIRRPERRPKDLAVRAGYYCIDTFTPLDNNAYIAAASAVDVALTAAEEILNGWPVAYALCRPPGHHAERRSFGGFCYFNNAAIAANFLSRHGKVATLDIDFHHGNGTQNIFYMRDDVLTISIHGHPNIAYPYFSGFADETGDGLGREMNINFPLQENAGEQEYLAVLNKALQHIKKFNPTFLVVSLGFDIMKGDPTGSFGLSTETMHKIGMAVSSLNLPTLVAQEGGYNLRNLKTGTVAFFSGIATSLINIKKQRKH